MWLCLEGEDDITRWDVRLPKNISIKITRWRSQEYLLVSSAGENDALFVSHSPFDMYFLTRLLLDYLITLALFTATRTLRRQL
jgi:hypothetical protein